MNWYNRKAGLAYKAGWFGILEHYRIMIRLLLLKKITEIKLHEPSAII